MDSSGEIIEVWDKEQLMGGPAKPEETGKKGKKDLDQLLLWGQPGHLTEAEADTYVSFLTSGGSLVYCFGRTFLALAAPMSCNQAFSVSNSVRISLFF